MLIMTTPEIKSLDIKIDGLRKYQYIVSDFKVINDKKNKISFTIIINDKKIEFKNIPCIYSYNTTKKVEIYGNINIDEIYNIINKFITLKGNSLEFDYENPKDIYQNNSQTQLVKYSKLDELNIFSMDELIILFILNNEVKYKCLLGDFLESKGLSIYKGLFEEKDYNVFLEVFKYFLEKNIKEGVTNLGESLYDCFVKIKPIDLLSIFKDKDSINLFVKMVGIKFKNNILERYGKDVEENNKKITSEKQIVVQSNIDLEKIAINKLKTMGLEELRYYIYSLDLTNEKIFNEIIIKVRDYTGGGKTFTSINKKEFSGNLYDRINIILLIHKDILKRYGFDLYSKFIEGVGHYFLGDLFDLYKTSYKDKELVKKINNIFQKDYRFIGTPNHYYGQRRVDNQYTVLINKGIEYIPELYSDLFLYVDNDYQKGEKALTMDLIKMIDKDFFDNNLTLDILIQYVLKNDINDNILNKKDFSFYDELFRYFRFIKHQTGTDEIGNISNNLISDIEKGIDYKTQSGGIDIYFSKYQSYYNLLNYVVLEVFKEIKSKGRFNIYQFFALIYLFRRKFLFKNSTSNEIIFTIINDIKIDNIDEDYLKMLVKNIGVEKTDIHYFLYQFTNKGKLILKMSKGNQKLIEEFVNKI